MENKRVLITGINGFTAGYLARLMLDCGGYDVFGTVRNAEAEIPKGAEAFVVDETYQSVYSAVSKAMPEIVFHLASRFVNRHKPEQISDIISSNITFGTHVAEACAHTGVSRIVNTGTFFQHIHGEAYNPLSLYAASKKAFEDILYFYVKEGKFEVINLHLPHIYGKNDTRPKVLNLFRDAALSGKETFPMSGGLQEMDILEVGDAASGILRAAFADTRGGMAEYSLTSGEPVTLREIIARLIEINGWNIKIDWGVFPYNGREDLKLQPPANPLPGWKPSVLPEEGLKNFV